MPQPDKFCSRCSLETDPEFYNFGGLGCARLPSPVLLAPDLLKPKPEKLTNNLSCAEMAVLNLHSEIVNIRVAAEGADYLYRMVAVISKGLLPILIWRAGRRDRSTLLSNLYGQ